MNVAPPAKALNPLLARYLASLEKNPLRTKAMTTGTVLSSESGTRTNNKKISCLVFPSGSVGLQFCRCPQKEGLEGCPYSSGCPGQGTCRYEGRQDGNLRVFDFSATWALPRWHPPEGVCRKERNWSENRSDSGQQPAYCADPGFR